MSELRDAAESEPKIYYVSFPTGCTLVRASNPVAATRFMFAEFGRHFGPYSVMHAAESDIAFVTAMGGVIHETEAT